MLFALIGVMVILASPWIFLYFSPKQAPGAAVRRFNQLTLLLAALACLALSLWIRQAMSGAEDYPLWPVVAATYSAMLFPVLLLIGGLLRNLVVFADAR